MSGSAAGWLLPAILLSSFVPSIAIFALPTSARRLRTTLNLAGALIKCVLVAELVARVLDGETITASFAYLPSVAFSLRADGLSLLLTVLSAALWLVTTVYAIGYLEGSPHPSRFFGFFGLCVTCTVGVSMAENLITLVVFYEGLTLSTYPLVVHTGTTEALRAGRRYLWYTLPSGALLLLTVVWLRNLVGPLSFEDADGVWAALSGHRTSLVCIFYLLIACFGVKAALVPFHGWLPTAMVAPAPVSALLHAVAVVKAGAFGIVRVVHDVFGFELLRELQVLPVLSILASITIIYGSVQALRQVELKKRLAYSTVSQISYIVLGVSLASPAAAVGAIIHLVHQGLMKVTLFFCAGNLSKGLRIHRVDQFAGVGRRMPLTMAAFTVGALGMIGVPPIAGYVSKWYLGLGALEAGESWVLLVLVASTLLNAGYFLPLVYAAWFAPLENEVPGGPQELSLWLLAPPAITALLALLVGIFAAWEFSPLGIAQWIRIREIRW